MRQPAEPAEQLLLALPEQADQAHVRVAVQHGQLQDDIADDLLHACLLTDDAGQLVLPAQPRMAASRTGRPSDKYGRDLTRLAQEGRLDPVLCRDAELDRMIEILCRRQKNNPCLLGEPGVGKSALAEALAQRIAAGQITPALRGKRVLALDMASMVAGTKYRGDFEERFKNLLEELYRDRSTILFIDEIHLIAGAGAAEEPLTPPAS